MNAATNQDFEKALARACLREVNQWLSLNPFVQGDASAVRYGAFLIDVAREAAVSVPQARRRMKALHDSGKVIRSDCEGGRTRWWLVGLASAQAVVATTPAPSRQALTPPTPTAATPTSRQRWSDVLGVERDCSTTAATRAYRAELARLNTQWVEQQDPEAQVAIQRLKEAYDACCREHDIQVQE